jgi:hypothetical protein
MEVGMKESSQQSVKSPFKAWLPEETRTHLKEARKAMRKSVESLLPPEYLEQRRKARREVLLAARSFIDHRLEEMEDRD